jgi:hypothetical protein
MSCEKRHDPVAIGDGRWVCERCDVDLGPDSKPPELYWVLFGKPWSHLPDPEPDEDDGGISGAAWLRHADLEQETTFYGRGLAVPGVEVEVNGKRYLLGDINKAGGTCDDCMSFDPSDIVTRYRVTFIPQLDLDPLVEFDDDGRMLLSMKGVDIFLDNLSKRLTGPLLKQVVAALKEKSP